MTNPQQVDMNPYQPPQSMNTLADAERKFRHRDFRLTIDQGNENRHFVIGNLRGAITFSLLQQAVWVVFMAFVPDGGYLLKLSWLAVAVFWSFIVAMAIVQRGKLSMQQTLVAKWGYMPIFLIVCNLVNLFVVISRMSA